MMSINMEEESIFQMDRNERKGFFLWCLQSSLLIICSEGRQEVNLNEFIEFFFLT